MKFAGFYLVFGLIAFTCPAIAAAQEPGSDPRFVIHLLDYLAKDYGGAVENGKVISVGEYAEQNEFSKSVLEAVKSNAAIFDDKSIVSGVEKLQSLIKNKANASEVTEQARSVQAKVISLLKLELYPRAWPNIQKGRALFAQNCISCHGLSGDGTGPVGKDLDPPPANFLDGKALHEVAPYQEFNVIRLGVPGTGMQPFPQFTDEDVWDLAFFVSSIRHSTDQDRKTSIGKAQDFLSVSTEHELLKKVASLSDKAILDQLNSKGIENSPTVVGSLRHLTARNDVATFFQIALGHLQETLEYARNGNYAKARNAALAAYLEGIEPAEPKLRANSQKSVEQLETRFMILRRDLESRSPLDVIEADVAASIKEVNTAQDLAGSKTMSPTLAFVSSFAIILREGFEAVLVILLLLGVLRASSTPSAEKAKKWVHGGWITALALGIVLWILTLKFFEITTQSRELVEAVSATLAVIVLLIVGIWLHTQSQGRKWNQFIKTRIQDILSEEKLWALSWLAFIAVFREVLEVVLFIQALWIEGAESSKLALLAGVVSSGVLVLLLSWISMRMTKRVPMRSLFQVSSWIMAGLSVVLAGKAAHALQEAGYLAVNYLPFEFRMDLVGVFPTTQTLTAQVIVAAIVLAFFFACQRREKGQVALIKNE